MADDEGSEASKGEVKHLVLGKFKDGVSQEEIDHLIKEFANLVNIIEPMKSFRWYLPLIIYIPHFCS